MTYSVGRLIADLELMFYRKESENEEAEARFMATIEKNLSHYKPEVLEAAAKHIMGTRKQRGFPVLAEIIAACNECNKGNVPPTPAKAKAGSVAAYERGEKRWNQLLDWKDRPAIIEKSAEENWHMALRGFFINTGRLPANMGEVAELRAEAVAFIDSLHEIIAADPANNPMATSLAKLGRSMIERRAAERARILGRHDPIPDYGFPVAQPELQQMPKQVEEFSEEALRESVKGARASSALANSGLIKRGLS